MINSAVSDNLFKMDKLKNKFSLTRIIIRIVVSVALELCLAVAFKWFIHK